jgi:hypothetical protein
VLDCYHMCREHSVACGAGNLELGGLDNELIPADVLRVEGCWLWRGGDGWQVEEVEAGERWRRIRAATELRRCRDQHRRYCAVGAKEAGCARRKGRWALWADVAKDLGCTRGDPPVLH